MFSQDVMGLLNELFIILPAFLLVFTFRGFFNALFATIMGDETPREHGFLTLNPLVHLDFFGFLIMLFVVFFIGGLLVGFPSRYFLFLMLILLGVRWVRSVPFDEGQFKRYRLGVTLYALSTFIGTSLLALCCMYFVSYFPFQLFPGYVFISLYQVFRVVIDVSLFFGVISLVPIPPFDCGRLLEFILPARFDYITEWLQEYSFYIFLALFFIPGISNMFFGMIHVVMGMVKAGLANLVF
jgi:Zn-dependent protease